MERALGSSKEGDVLSPSKAWTLFSLLTLHPGMTRFLQELQFASHSLEPWLRRMAGAGWLVFALG